MNTPVSSSAAVRRPAYRLVRRPPSVLPPLLQDPLQTYAVSHVDGPLLVVGGPGTGKTTTLVESVAARIASGVDPERILVLTFGRRGASALRDRIEARIAADPGRIVHEPLVRTFHAYAFGLLRRAAADRGEPSPRLLTGPEQDLIIRELLEISGDPDEPDPIGWPVSLRPALPTRAFAQQLRDLLQRAAERGIDAVELARLGERLGRDDWPAAARFLREYVAVLALRDVTTRGSSAYDPAELVRAASGLLADTPELLEAERRRLEYVYVDELADTDPAQIELLSLVAGGGKPLVAFGDPDSSVYGFRGADPGAVANFPSRFRTASGALAETLTFHTNYRAPGPLLSATLRVARRMRGPISHRPMHPPPPLLGPEPPPSAPPSPGAGQSSAPSPGAGQSSAPSPGAGQSSAPSPGAGQSSAPESSSPSAGSSASAQFGAIPSQPTAPGVTPARRAPGAGASDPAASSGSASDTASPGDVPSTEPASPAGQRGVDAAAEQQGGAGGSVGGESPAERRGGAGVPVADGRGGTGGSVGGGSPDQQRDVAGVSAAAGRGGSGVAAAGRRGEPVGGELRAEAVVRVFRAATAEAAFVAHALREAHLLHGVPWSRMAVLLRSTTLQLPSLQRALAAAGVPTVTHAEDLPLHLQPAVAPFLLLLRCALDPEALTEETAVALLHSSLGGADPLAERRLRQGLRALALSAGDRRPSGELLVDAVRDPAGLDMVERRWAVPAQQVARLLATAREAASAPGATAEQVLWTVWRASGLADRWYAMSTRSAPMADNTDVARARQWRAEAADRDLDSMVVLFDAAARFVDRLPGARTEVFLDHVLGQDLPADSIAPSADRGESVRLLTAHAAKGLEWDVVVMAGVQEGIWPDLRLRGSLLGSERLVDVIAGRAASGQAAVVGQTSALLDEERRLFYVAATRARHKLIVTAVASAGVGGSEGEEQPSRFLTELGLSDEGPGSPPPPPPEEPPPGPDLWDTDPDGPQPPDTEAGEETAPSADGVEETDPDNPQAPGTEGVEETDPDNPQAPGTEGVEETDPDNPQAPGTEGVEETDPDNPQAPPREGADPQAPGTEGVEETDPDNPQEPGTEGVEETDPDNPQAPDPVGKTERAGQGTAKTAAGGTTRPAAAKTGGPRALTAKVEQADLFAGAGWAGDEPPDDEPEGAGPEGTGPEELTVARPPRALTLAALVAELRTVVVGTDQTPARRRAAAAELARLAAAGVPGAHPDEWWGLRPLSDDRPLVDEGDPVKVTPSSMESALRCSLRWLLERHGGAAPPGPAQGVGNLVHAAAMLAEDANADREKLVEYVSARFDAIELAARWLAGPEQDRAQAMVDKLLRWLAGNPRRLLAIEHEFTVRLEDQKRPIQLTGRVDRLEIDEDGRLVVIDLKTGKTTAVAAADLAEHAQLAGYQTAVEAGAFADYGAESGGAALVQLGPGKDAREQMQLPLAEAADPQWAYEMVRRTADTMAAATFSAVANSRCRVCPVRTSCPISGKGRQVVDEGQ
ncbi:PD-(D/E)XK nuclease family protein [Actinoplanes sp. LDG1-06]|uniref:DNA 3'-5' helicase n=1 Tax=Paractinoplanes ovalisporus TaxID=2810368 RepID=A0ABS2ATC9_9ACTN|nr:UvrD-helicase domain-containing protein [Actinoplanes ovalisporus]MBM2622476.1 PD-(D/E)XK nuclease family protein [Actinoplanes ovalisporus]